MRKILLTTTAVIGAALLAPTLASAQTMPAVPFSAANSDLTVRVGGYFAGWYSHTTQSNPNTFNGAIPIAPNGSTGVTAASSASPQAGTGSAKTGKNDFHSDTEIHVYVDGKAANGLRYGAVVEMSFNGSEGTSPASGRRTFSFKTGGLIDEMYAYAALPNVGQVRFGDEDGAVGLMTTGVVTGFGTGGVYGSWQNSVIRPNRTTTSPGDLGDSTKLIYLSPQMFGFDFGASFSLNSNTGANNGCVQSFAVYSCDRTYAYTGATGNAIQSWSDLPQRRNEVQAVLRYRGQFGPVGVAASVGHVGWTAIRDITTSGAITMKTLRPGNIWMAGAQASAYGFTLGAMYQWGQANYFWGSQAKGDQNQSQWTVGGTYTMGPLTIGSNAFWGSYAGGNGFAFNGTTGAYTRNTNGTQFAMRRMGISAGANYRLAPGLDLVAEYVRHAVSERGNNALAGAGASVSQDKLRADVIIVGTRLAF